LECPRKSGESVNPRHTTNVELEARCQSTVVAGRQISILGNMGKVNSPSTTCSGVYLYRPESKHGGTPTLTNLKRLDKNKGQVKLGEFTSHPDWRNVTDPSPVFVKSSVTAKTTGGIRMIHTHTNGSGFQERHCKPATALEILHNGLTLSRAR
jgi:hypothetical protein